MSRVEATYRALIDTGSPERLSRLTELFRRAENAINDEAEDPEPVLALLKEETGETWEADYFFELWGWTSPEDLAKDWAMDAQVPPDLAEDELASLLSRIEFYSDRIVRAFDHAYGDAFGHDLMFRPYREMEPIELAREIFKRKRLLAHGALDKYELEVATALQRSSDAQPWALEWARLKLSSRN